MFVGFLKKENSSNQINTSLVQDYSFKDKLIADIKLKLDVFK